MTPYVLVIPARLGSTRLPEKALADVAGKPLVVRVLEAARTASAARVIVATDALEIARVVRAAGGEVAMTRDDHASGTDRIAEVVAGMELPPEAIVVNLQGDEPHVPASLLDGLAAALDARPDAALATLAAPITTPAELFDPNVVKVTCDDEGYALTFSRAPIPWVRDAFVPGRPDALPSGVPFLRHLGLYAYRAATLARLCVAEESVLERAERLEQLRALAMGMRIHVGLAAEAPLRGVDTLEDLEAARAAFAPRHG